MITVSVRQWNEEDFTIMEDEVADIISKNSVGGVILFAENFTDTEQTVNLTTAFQNAALKSKNKIPLFISTDQEGGEVVRLNKGTSLPGNMALGAINSASDAKTVGGILGSELSALGINVDFAPSLDVNSNPINPIIGVRSFSSDPNIVANLGVQVINGIQEKMYQRRQSTFRVMVILQLIHIPRYQALIKHLKSLKIASLYRLSRQLKMVLI